MSNSIRGKVALITGGSKGIGFGIAQVLLSRGARVVLTSRSENSAQQAATALADQADADSVTAVAADVRSLEAMQRAVNTCIDTYGSLDVVVANAGLGHFGNIESLSPEQWRETIDTNLTGVYNTLKPAIAALRQSKGYFITIASLAGTNFFAGGSAYNASKFGLVGFTQAVMLDLRSSGIKVSTIMPGSVNTHFAGSEPRADQDWKIAPEDIGHLVRGLLEMDPRTLPSKIEVRPSNPPAH